MGDAAAEAKLHLELECDLIMRGGITSGVVFPKAITRLARKYRFVSIGGTSAGSIAAVMAAAAEYRRATGATAAEQDAGFAVIDGMADDLARNLKTLFQPSPQTRPLFDIAMRVIASGGSRSAFLAGALSAFRAPAAMAAAPGLLLLLWALYTANAWAFVVAVLALLVGPTIAVTICLWRAVTEVLPAHDFGLCSGLRTDASAPLAFTDWIAKKLDEAAGLDPDSEGYRPLTAGDLRTAGGWAPSGEARAARIRVASVTTDLASGRPYQLPIGTEIFSFRKSEFDRLFPTHIVDYLARTENELKSETGEAFRDAEGNSDYYRLLGGDDFPILLVARLSLSFPGLISAVPLYRIDYTVKNKSGERGVLVRCLFSDGGITSNFPIHFFDALLPRRPTFGISLGSIDKRSFPTGTPIPRAARVFLPIGAGQGAASAAHAITGLMNFAGAILDTARNWQDTLQSRLHGYRERIVEIRLDDEAEGGLNLDMKPSTVNDLVSFGDDAAEKLLDAFIFDEHRWRRAVTALPALGVALDQFAKAWADPTYRDLLLKHPSRRLSQAQRDQLVAFADNVAAVAATIPAGGLPTVYVHRANLRVVASIDTDDDEDAAGRAPTPSPVSVPVS
jgi:predicted acylesterase/phospholipase RssA